METRNAATAQNSREVSCSLLIVVTIYKYADQADQAIERYLRLDRKLIKRNLDYRLQIFSVGRAAQVQRSEGGSGRPRNLTFVWLNKGRYKFRHQSSILTGSPINGWGCILPFLVLSKLPVALQELAMLQ